MPRPAPSESQSEIHRFQGVPHIWPLDNIRAELGHPQPSYLHGVDARVLPDHVQLCARHPRRCAQIVEGMSSTLMTHLRMILEHGHRTAAKPKGADRADARGDPLPTTQIRSDQAAATATTAAPSCCRERVGMGITPLSFAFFPRGGATARTSNPRPGPRARRRGHLTAYRRVLCLLLGRLLGRRLLQRACSVSRAVPSAPVYICT